MVKANDRSGQCQFYVIANNMGHDGEYVTSQLPLQTYFCDASTSYELILQNVVDLAVEEKNYSIEEIHEVQNAKPKIGCCW